MIKEPELEVVPVYGDMPEMIFDSLIICNKKRCFRIFFCILRIPFLQTQHCLPFVLTFLTGMRRNIDKIAVFLSS